MIEKTVHLHHTNYETACGINPVGLSKTKNPTEVTCMNCRRSSKWDKAIKKYQAEKEKPDVPVAIPPTSKNPVIRVPKIHLSRRFGRGVECNCFLIPNSNEMSDNVVEVTCESCKRTKAYKNATKNLKAKFEETKLETETERTVKPKEQKQRTFICMSQREFSAYDEYNNIEEAKEASQYEDDEDGCVILEVVTIGKKGMIWDDSTN